MHLIIMTRKHYHSWSESLSIWETFQSGIKRWWSSLRHKLTLVLKLLLIVTGNTAHEQRVQLHLINMIIAVEMKRWKGKLQKLDKGASSKSSGKKMYLFPFSLILFNQDKLWFGQGDKGHLFLSGFHLVKMVKAMCRCLLCNEKARMILSLS